MKKLFALLLTLVFALTLCACNFGIVVCSYCDRSIAANADVCHYCEGINASVYTPNVSQNIIGVWNNSNEWGTFTYIFYDDGLFYGVYYGEYVDVLPTLSGSDYSYYGCGGGYWSAKNGKIEIKYNDYDFEHIYEYEFNDDFSKMTVTLKTIDGSDTKQPQATLWYRAENGYPATDFFIRNPNGVVTVDETNVISVEAVYDENSGYAVRIGFDDIGAYSFARDTQNYVGEEFLVNLDGAWIVAPTVEYPITDGDVLIALADEYDMQILVRRLENAIS